MSGQPFLSSFMATSTMRMVSFLESSIVYLKSTSTCLNIQYLINFGLQYECHYRSSKVSTCHPHPCRTLEPFPVHSWMNLRHVFDTCPWKPYHFRDYRNYFCQPHTSSNFTFATSLLPATFHPRRWPL